MSNRNKEKEYDNITDAMRFVFEQMVKDLFIVAPGIIESYDKEKKRCRVRIAIDIRKTDGSTFTPTPIVNVPVLWPSGGGFSLVSPLPVGEPVEILFTQRGITKFKEVFAQAAPGEGMFSKEDATVRPGYGGLSITPATDSGMAMQSDDGANYIFVENGIVKIVAGTKIVMEAPEIEANAATQISLNTPLLNLAGNLTMQGNISGPTVFGGAGGEDHGHTQDNDSDGDTQQKTDGPS